MHQPPQAVTLKNKDIGFVSADGLQDNKRGSIFPATLTLDASQMNIDGKPIRLSPGMNVTAEIKTGQNKHDKHGVRSCLLPFLTNMGSGLAFCLFNLKSPHVQQTWGQVLLFAFLT